MVGIIGAMDVEVNALKSMVENPIRENVSGIEFVSGKIYGQDVVIASCGVGKVFAAIAAEAMILKYSPGLIINSGVAGSTCEELGICDVAIAETVVQHDMDTTPLGDPPGLLSGINIVDIPCSQKAVKLLKKCVDGLGIHNEIGKIASGDEFVDTVERKKEIAEKFNAIACEMEGASIGHVCYVNKVDFAVIRAVSDSLADGSNMEYTEFVKIAADNSIKVLDSFLKNYK